MGYPGFCAPHRHIHRLEYHKKKRRGARREMGVWGDVRVYAHENEQK